MNGEWIIFVWALVSVIFLAKLSIIRELFAKVRKMSAIGIICMVLSLGYFANISYTKDGVNTNQSTSQTVSLSAENSSSLTQSSISARTGLPDFWNDDPTDTDGDGIPDLWEKWTHGKKLVADSDLDRDDDGLTDLEEFWNQTDPRTADTDGDSFSDAFEVANGMNPVSAEDFIPVEPDSNNNGVPDIWEQIGYSGCFQDANGNGFDDTYERNSLPAASDSNFDVLVDVYTTRSAALNWTSGENTLSTLILPTTGTSVKIRLPFGSDTELYLQSSPYGTDLPSGELWKSRMRISFAPRAGQTLTGNALISSEGIIAHKVVGQATVITRFPDATDSKQVRSLDSGDDHYPRIELRYRRLGIKPVDAAWHFVDELIGPFAITNLAGTLPQSVSWMAEHGSVSSDGTTAFLTVTFEPPAYESVSITAISELDEATFVTNRLAIPECARSVFGLVAATDNFSPHLGETASFTLTIPGCPHSYQEGWLEGELMRETTEGWQHVGWLDASQAQPGNQKRRHCLAGPQTIVWNGIATEGAALADSPDVFTNSVSSFHRALPQVISGEPVPPPYYTLFFRYSEEDSDSAAIIAEASTKVYVPQVVKVEITNAAYNEFNKQILYPETFYPQLLGKTNDVVGCQSNVVLYAGNAVMTMSQVLDSVVEKCQSLITGEVHLRYTRYNVTGRYKHAKIVIVEDINKDVRNSLGFTPNEHVSWINTNPFGECYIYIDKMRESPCLDKYRTENQAFPPATYDPSLFPFTSDELANALASVATHETGHTLGLVHRILYGTTRSHNKTNSGNGFIMNNGIPFMQLFAKPSALKKSWNSRNHEYLQFILPKK